MGPRLKTLTFLIPRANIPFDSRTEWLGIRTYRQQCQKHDAAAGERCWGELRLVVLGLMWHFPQLLRPVAPVIGVSFVNTSLFSFAHVDIKNTQCITNPSQLRNVKANK